MAEDVKLVLMHAGEYPLANGGTANFVVGAKDCLRDTRSMNSSSTTAGGWNACEMRTYLNTEIYNQLPEGLKSLFKLMNVWTSKGTEGIYSQDHVALPAEKEIFGSNTFANSSIELDLFQLDWYKTESNRVKKLGGSASVWWNRSPHKSDSRFFCGVFSTGSADHRYAGNPFGVSFFCCI